MISISNSNDMRITTTKTTVTAMAVRVSEVIVFFSRQPAQVTSATAVRAARCRTADQDRATANVAPDMMADKTTARVGGGGIRACRCFLFGLYFTIPCYHTTAGRVTATLLLLSPESRSEFKSE